MGGRGLGGWVDRKVDVLDARRDETTMLLGSPTAAEFKCNKRRCKQMRVQSANATGASAGISVDKREHEGRGAAGWVILFDPVRGLDESTRQRLCSCARHPDRLLSCFPLSEECVSLHSLFLTALSSMPVDLTWTVP